MQSLGHWSQSIVTSMATIKLQFPFSDSLFKVIANEDRVGFVLLWLMTKQRGDEVFWQRKCRWCSSLSLNDQGCSILRKLVNLLDKPSRWLVFKKFMNRWPTLWRVREKFDPGLPKPIKCWLDYYLCHLCDWTYYEMIRKKRYSEN